MRMLDTWRVSTPNNDGTVYVTDSGSNSRGPAMLPEEAQEVVTAHNRSQDNKLVEEFRNRVRKFLSKDMLDLVDLNDPRTHELYWPLVILMTDSTVALFEAATVVQYPMLQLKADADISPDPNNRKPHPSDA